MPIVICKKCGKIRLNGKTAEESYSQKHPFCRECKQEEISLKISLSTKGRIPWNKGLNKNNHSSIKGHQGENNPAWQGGLTKLKLICPDCDGKKSFSAKHCRKCSYKYISETKKKNPRVKNKNSNWKGGVYIKGKKCVCGREKSVYAKKCENCHIKKLRSKENCYPLNSFCNYNQTHPIGIRWKKYRNKKGKEYKVQGSYEYAYIKWLDSNNISFICHPSGVEYFSHEYNRKRKYYPDFYLIKENVYIDVKNDWLINNSQTKFEDIRKSNPNLKFQIISFRDLKNIGAVL